MKAKDLKNSILQMAVEGKLVPQDPTDEPATVLLERIREEKHRLIAEGKAKFPKGGESIIYTASDGSPYEKRVDAKGRVLSDECVAGEVPFEELPEGWAWARLGSLLALISDGTHKTPQYTESGVLFLSVQNVSSGSFDLTKVRHVSRETHKELCKRAKPSRGDILLCRIGTLGKPIIVDVDYEFSIFVSLGLLRPISTAIAKWICSCIDSPVGFAWIEDVKVGGGTHTFKINLGDIPNFILPVPPLAEQRRIVGRANELMPLVEEYGRLEDAREELDTALPDRLRKSVLQMAVQGKLVSQDPTDEPACKLLKRICDQRHELVAEKKMKAPKGGESIIFRGSDGRRYEKRIDVKGRESEPVCIEDEILFEIPGSWEWARLGSLVLNRGQKKPDSRFSYIDIASIDNANQKLGQETVMDAAEAPSRARKLVEKDDVLYATVRPYLHNACIIDKDFEFEPIASTGFATLTCPDGFLPDFLLYYLVSPCFDEYVNASENAKGVAYPAINDNRLYRALVPIPPTDEQERIISELSEVLAFTKQ